MTKLFIIIGIALGALLISGVILSLVAPKRILIQNKQFIKASPKEVFDQIRFMNNFPNWSPFREEDPDQKFTISEIDGEVGATFSWTGVKEKSKGLQRITSLEENKRVLIKCEITEPFQSNPSFEYQIYEKNGGVELIQTFDTEMPVPTNIFGLLLGLKDKISTVNKRGLQLLKINLEKE